MAARVHDERVRRQQRFNLFEQQKPLLTVLNQARCGLGQDEGCTFHLGRQRRYTCLARGALGSDERSARLRRLEASHRDPRDNQLVGSSRRGRERRGVELGELTLGLVEAPDQEEVPNLEILRKGGVRPVTVLFECRARCLKRFRGPTQVARDDRDLCLGDNTSGASHDLFRTEGARSASHECFGPWEITEPRHRDASKRKRRSVVAQGHPIQRSEGVTSRERTRCGCDQRVKLNPVKLVTPTIQCPILIYLMITNHHIVSRPERPTNHIQWRKAQ
jgi:hypothetical protein